MKMFYCILMIINCNVYVDNHNLITPLVIIQFVPQCKYHCHNDKLKEVSWSELECANITMHYLMHVCYCVMLRIE